MSRVEFSTSNYEFAHGRAPRGQGGWAFRPYGSNDVMEFVFFHGSYSDARRQAASHFSQRGVYRVEVGS